MATCFTTIKVVGADQTEYDLWKTQLQSAIDTQGFVIIEDDPEAFTFAIRHEDII